ncbi:MAG TPA: hypothetical protein VMH40_09305 [Myxococcaceae bacterium]|nr:hypothetical protein [Anaeromyxobacteraceae bacterium]HTS80781.1 hypothetical protein [Myxococcaceae bacterium]
MSKLMSLKEMARIAGVGLDHLALKVGSGRLKALRTSAGGWLVDEDEAFVALGLRFNRPARPVEPARVSEEPATPAGAESRVRMADGALSSRAKRWAAQLGVSEAELAKRMARGR